MYNTSNVNSYPGAHCSVRRVYVFGSLAYDRLVEVEQSFLEVMTTAQQNQGSTPTFHVSSMLKFRGGTAGNIAYSLNLLGEKSIILSSVGNDFDEYAQAMLKNDLSFEGIRVYPDEITATCVLLTDPKGKQVAVYYPSAMSLSCKPDLNTVKPDDILVVSPGNPSDMAILPLAGRLHKMFVVYDPGQRVGMLKTGDLIAGFSNADITVSNKEELEIISNRLGKTKEELRSMTGTLITTDGANGISINNGEATIPATPPTRFVDATGAGDAFRAGLVKGILAGMSIPDAAKVGSVAATYCVENQCGQGFYYTPDAFAKRFNDTFQMALPWQGK